MKDPLATYLHDHLAGAAFAVELLEALRDQHSAEPLGQFASDLLIEVEKDRTTLRDLTKLFDTDSNILKEAASWLSEKASRLKLRRHAEGTLGTFETLEALALGILGKEALWTTLANISAQDLRLQGLDYPGLIVRARTQHVQAETRRICLSNTAFAPGEKRSPD